MRWSISSILLVLGITLNAQVNIAVTYYTPMQDETSSYTKSVIPYTLQCNNRHSLFVKQEAKNRLDYSENSQQLALHYNATDSWVFKDFGRRHLSHFTRSFREKKFLIRDKLHPISWKIMTDKKTIGNIEVQKARGTFRGRTYTAWFAASLPVSSGPWKLGGLPGLILEAYDDDKLVVFLFRSVQWQPHRPLEMPQHRVETITLEQYQALYEEEIKTYYAFLNGRLKQAGSSVRYQLGTLELWEYPKPDHSDTKRYLTIKK